MERAPSGAVVGAGQRAARYALRVSRSVIVNLSLSRRNAASESEKKPWRKNRGSWFVVRKSLPLYSTGLWSNIAGGLPTRKPLRNPDWGHLLCAKGVTGRPRRTFPPLCGPPPTQLSVLTISLPLPAGPKRSSQGRQGRQGPYAQNDKTSPIGRGFLLGLRFLRPGVFLLLRCVRW